MYLYIYIYLIFSQFDDKDNNKTGKVGIIDSEVNPFKKTEIEGKTFWLCRISMVSTYLGLVNSNKYLYGILSNN